MLKILHSLIFTRLNMSQLSLFVSVCDKNIFLHSQMLLKGGGCKSLRFNISPLHINKAQHSPPKKTKCFFFVFVKRIFLQNKKKISPIRRKMQTIEGTINSISIGLIHLKKCFNGIS